jgi:hypothetical protein
MQALVARWQLSSFYTFSRSCVAKMDDGGPKLTDGFSFSVHLKLFNLKRQI